MVSCSLWIFVPLLLLVLIINIIPIHYFFPPARNQAFDVVLVDTAGRMQDNAPLMTALAKLIAVNVPDLVLFVGEALVGNEAVDQLVRQKPVFYSHICSNMHNMFR